MKSKFDKICSKKKVEIEMSEDEKREDYNFDQGCPDPTSSRARVDSGQSAST